MDETTPKNPTSPKELAELYENGKKRRYELLFAVNGGALAIVKWMLETPVSPSDYIAAYVISLAMVLFSMFMGYDIYQFGIKMKEWREEVKAGPDIFARPGKVVAFLISSILTIAWVLFSLLYAINIPSAVREIFKLEFLGLSSKPFLAVPALLAFCGVALICWINELEERDRKTSTK